MFLYTKNQHLECNQKNDIKWTRYFLSKKKKIVKLLKRLKQAIET